MDSIYLFIIAIGFNMITSIRIESPKIFAANRPFYYIIYAGSQIKMPIFEAVVNSF